MEQFRAAGQRPPPPPIEERDVKYYNDPRLNAYEQFLQGERYAILSKYYGNGKISINGWNFNEGENKFKLFDIDHDGKNELVFNLPNTIYVMGYLDGELTVWFIGRSFDALLENGAILSIIENKYFNPPKIIYEYTEVSLNERNITIEKTVCFEERDSEASGVFDTFIFEGESLSESEWDRKTQNYFSIPELEGWHIFDRKEKNSLFLEEALGEH